MMGDLSKNLNVHKTINSDYEGLYRRTPLK
jgi:hypothetical protein